MVNYLIRAALAALLFVAPAFAEVPTPQQTVAVIATPFGDMALTCGGNGALTYGSCANGLYSTGSVVNPTTSQVLLGPIDTANASSWGYYITIASGSGAAFQIQEGPTTAGPWTTMVGQTTTVSTGQLSSSFPTSSGPFAGPVHQRYIQVIASTGGTETVTIQGYLRSALFTPNLGANVVSGTVATQLNGASSNFGTTTFPLTGSRQVPVTPYSIPEVTWQYSTNGTAITTNTSTTLQAAQAASVRNYLAAFSCDNTGTGVATELQILDGSTVIYDGYIGAASATLNNPHLTVTFPVPLRGTAATAMSLKTLTTGAALYCSAQGYAAY